MPPQPSDGQEVGPSPGRAPKQPDDLDDPAERGEKSQEGFGDYDRDFHPTKIDQSDDGPSRGGDDAENSGRP